MLRAAGPAPPPRPPALKTGAEQASSTSVSVTGKQKGHNSPREGTDGKVVYTRRSPRQRPREGQRMHTRGKGPSHRHRPRGCDLTQGRSSAQAQSHP